MLYSVGWNVVKVLRLPDPWYVMNLTCALRSWPKRHSSERASREELAVSSSANGRLDALEPWSRMRPAELTLGIGSGRLAPGSHPGALHRERGGRSPGDAAGLLHAGLERAWQDWMEMISAVGHPPLFLGDYVTVC